MKTWLLILFINGHFTRESYSVSLEFDTRQECVTNGINVSKDLRIVRNKDSKWTKMTVRTAKYSCSKIIRRVKLGN